MSTIGSRKSSWIIAEREFDVGRAIEVAIVGFAMFAVRFARTVWASLFQPELLKSTLADAQRTEWISPLTRPLAFCAVSIVIYAVTLDRVAPMMIPGPLLKLPLNYFVSETLSGNQLGAVLITVPFLLIVSAVAYSVRLASRIMQIPASFAMIFPLALYYSGVYFLLASFAFSYTTVLTSWLSTPVELVLIAAYVIGFLPIFGLFLYRIFKSLQQLLNIGRGPTFAVCEIAYALIMMIWTPVFLLYAWRVGLFTS